MNSNNRRPVDTELLSGGICKSEDFEAVKERMATFMASGFHAICQKEKK